jgi:hypothetical protein
MTLSVWATNALTGVRMPATAMTVATIEFDLIQFNKVPNFPNGAAALSMLAICGSGLCGRPGLFAL